MGSRSWTCCRSTGELGHGMRHRLLLWACWAAAAMGWAAAGQQIRDSHDKLRQAETGQESLQTARL